MDSTLTVSQFPSTGQKKQSEWHEQWSLLQDDELFLFQDWIAPLQIEDFKDQTVLEGGCGGGQHTSFVAPLAKRVVAADLNTVDIAKKRNAPFPHVEFVEADIAQADFGEKFDVVFSVGVIHHTDSPDATFHNLAEHVKPGGKMAVWVYAAEGNFLVASLVEPLRKRFLTQMSRPALLRLSKAICLAMYLPIFSLYLLPLKFLPYYAYFQNFRKLSFYRNTLNIFDKLNAPQVQFITRERIENWFRRANVRLDSLTHYKGVSWSGVGIKQ
jgi:SAM-dependent methyltransferase